MTKPAVTPCHSPISVIVTSCVISTMAHTGSLPLERSARVSGLNT